MVWEEEEEPHDAGKEPLPPSPQYHMLCVPPAVPAEPRWAWGIGSPCHPVSEAPEAWHHQQRWRLSAPRAFRSTRIARPQDREAQSEAWPSSLEQRRPHVGRPPAFLEVLGAETAPQVDGLPLWRPKALCTGWASLRRGPVSVLAHDLVETRAHAADVSAEKAPFVRPPISS